MSFMESAIQRVQREMHAKREAAIRETLMERMPRRLHWAIDHPRVLRVLFFVRPKWRPTIVEHTSFPYVDLAGDKLVVTDGFEIR